MSRCIYCPCPVYQDRVCWGCFESNNIFEILSVSRCLECEEYMCPEHASFQSRCSMVCIQCDDNFDHDEESNTELEIEEIDPVWYLHNTVDTHEPPQTIKRTSASESFSKKECLICLETFKLGDMLGTLECHASHTFHDSCISEWHEHSRTCPLCRK